MKLIATVINDLRSDQRMFRICSSLSTKYDVTLIGRLLPDSRAVTDQTFKQNRIKCWFITGPLFYLEYNIRLVFKLRTKLTKHDTLNTVDADTLVAGYMLKRLTGCTWIFDSHEYFSEVPELQNHPVKKRMWQYVEKRLIPEVDKAYTVGPKLAELFSEQFNKPFDCIRNAPVLKKSSENEKEFVPAVFKAHQKILLYQGALNKGRGLEACIEAMTQLEEVHLLLIGTGDIENDLKGMVDALDLQQKVTFEGFVPPQQLPHYTHNAYAGLNISENLGISYFLSLNNKCFDYIHAQLPAITNSFPEYEEVNRRHEVMVLCNSDVDDIVYNVSLLLKNDKLYQKLKDNCLLAKEDFNWGKEEQRLFRIYE